MQSWFVSFKLYMQPAHPAALGAAVTNDHEDNNTRTEQPS
jgi:hypothetical protein